MMQGLPDEWPSTAAAYTDFANTESPLTMDEMLETVRNRETVIRDEKGGE